MITSLADFKRLPVGTKILTVQGAGKAVGTVRKIEHKQTNAIRFEGGSWLEYPKASEFRVEGSSIFVESRDADGNIWNVLEYQVIK